MSSTPRRYLDPSRYPPSPVGNLPAAPSALRAPWIDAPTSRRSPRLNLSLSLHPSHKEFQAGYRQAVRNLSRIACSRAPCAYPAPRASLGTSHLRHARSAPRVSSPSVCHCFILVQGVPAYVCERSHSPCPQHPRAPTGSRRLQHMHRHGRRGKRGKRQYVVTVCVLRAEST